MVVKASDTVDLQGLPYRDKVVAERTLATHRVDVPSVSRPSYRVTAQLTLLCATAREDGMATKRQSACCTLIRSPGQTKEVFSKATRSKEGADGQPLESILRSKMTDVS